MSSRICCILQLPVQNNVPPSRFGPWTRSWTRPWIRPWIRPHPLGTQYERFSECASLPDSNPDKAGGGVFSQFISSMNHGGVRDLPNRPLGGCNSDKMRPLHPQTAAVQICLSPCSFRPIDVQSTLSTRVPAEMARVAGA